MSIEKCSVMSAIHNARTFLQWTSGGMVILVWGRVSQIELEFGSVGFF